MKTYTNRILTIALFVAMLLAAVDAGAMAPRRGKKGKHVAAAPAPSRYKVLTGRDSVSMQGVMNVVQKGDTIYLEMPVNLMGRAFLVSNKLQQVPAELNEASANRGINYENQMVRFEWDRKAGKVKMRQQRVTPEAPQGSLMAVSVADNYVDPLVATFKVEAVNIADAYYIIGGNGSWNSDKSQKFSHSDRDVFEDPVFTYVLTGGSELWFAFGEAEALDATDNGDWNQLYGYVGEQGTTGSYDRRSALGGEFTFHLDGAAKFYRFSINVLTKTYEITPLNFDPFIYYIGATDGWANAEQKLALTDESGIYTGFLYCADPNGWGNEFKFQKVPGNWDSQLNSGSFSGGITGDFADGGDNIKATAGEGVYFVTLDMGNMTLNAVKVQKMGLIGDFNGWGGDVEMTWNANDYCFEATGAGVTANGWKFRINADWAINLGSNDGVEPSTVLNDLVANGKNIGVAGSTVKLYPTRKTSDKIYCTVE